MSSPYVWHLSDEVLVHIFSFLSAEDVGRAASVCSHWPQVAEDRRLWRGKSYLAEGGRGLSDAFPFARALAALKRVSIHRGEDHMVYLSWEVADFRVPDLTDEATTSVISSLVTENLSVDFCLMEEMSNCLLVQLHCQKHLQVCAVPTLLPREAAMAKLRALTGTLYREPLPVLRSVVVDTGRYSVEVDEDVESDILAALATCPALDWLSLRTHCSLSWQAVGEFSKLQFLQLQQCIIEDISFLDTFPNLRSLTLDNCSPLGRGELSCKSELRGLPLRRMPVDSELLDALCRCCPELESIVIEECPSVAHTLFLEQCPQLRFVEVHADGWVFPRVSGLPSELRQLRLNLPTVTSDSLAEMVKQLPRLQILDVVNCDIRSLSFLIHCDDLTTLSLGLEHRNTMEHFNELGA